MTRSRLVGALAALSVFGLSACEPHAPPAPEPHCLSSHEEPADMADVWAAYALTGSKLVAAAAAQPTTVCDLWEDGKTHAQPT